METRMVCADLKHGNGCKQALVADKNEKMEVTCFCVYCDHPNAKRKYVGKVEYNFPCYSPMDCPRVQEQRKLAKQVKPQEVQTEKEKHKMTIAVVGRGRKSLWETIKSFFKK